MTKVPVTGAVYAKVASGALAPPSPHDSVAKKLPQVVLPLTDMESALPRSRGSSWNGSGQLGLMRRVKLPPCVPKPSTMMSTR
jgi:hypothetical protein